MKQDPQQIKLVAQCKKGDRRAQRQLYDQYSKAMFNICLRMVRSEADAEDMLQNAFVDVFSKIHTFRSESTIGAWIKRIVINTCLNYIKKRKLELTEWDERIPEPTSSGNDSEFEETALTVIKVRNAMEQLPDGYRTVFTLYLMEGYDHKEIAQVLDITEATSKSQYSRAKQKLRDIITEME